MGERFAGRYELVDHLGDGGGGSVWRAWDAKTGRYVAAKLLRQRDAAALLRFVREQSMRVAHPHVIAPHGWAAEDDDVLRLADFGIAVALDDPRLTATGFVVGTPGYVAPEVLAGAAPDLRQDLWSVAVVTRHLLTGIRPGDSPSGMPLAADQQAPLPGTVPVEAVRWLDWLGAPAAADRPGDARTARQALAELGCWKSPRWESDEEPVEVFDHLATWPPGWTPAGPAAVEAPRRQALLGKGENRGATTVPVRPAPTRPDPRAGWDPPTRREPPPLWLAPVPSSLPPPSPAARPGPAGTGRPARSGPSLGRLVQLVAAAVLAGTAVVAFVLASQANEDPVGGVNTGDSCDFTQVDQTRTDGGDTITCVLEDGEYVWQR